MWYNSFNNKVLFHFYYSTDIFNKNQILNEYKYGLLLS